MNVFEVEKLGVGEYEVIGKEEVRSVGDYLISLVGEDKLVWCDDSAIRAYLYRTREGEAMDIYLYMWWGGDDNSNSTPSLVEIILYAFKRHWDHLWQVIVDKVKVIQIL